LPVGAELAPGGVHFRVWAPGRKRVELVVLEGDVEARSAALEPEPHGYFSGLVAGIGAGARYLYRLAGEDRLLPDPASRFQPDGPMGPSQVVDPAAFAWTDADWPGVGGKRHVVYEMHIGTFTREGTWTAAAEQLATLAEDGITLLEVMPVGDFTGRFGWGYDGVNLFAPTRLYGGPNDFRRFVDRAHQVGLGVILDVVYNHLGPVGNFLPRFSEDYLTEKHTTDWGKAINFDGDNCQPVRELFIANAGYWIDEFHLDGLRLDATQNIYDYDPRHEHILAAVVRRAREAASPRTIFVVGENEPQHVKLIEDREKGGYGLDALWNDDLHHSAVVALTGRKEAYYTDYRGSPQEFVSAAKYGFLYQGQWYKWQKQPRGTPFFGFEPERLVTFTQNHDQIANSGNGQRIHRLTSPGRYRALTGYFLLSPGTPMLFMGQEFGASAPFLYFADHDAELADLVHEGRREFLQQFRSLATPEMQEAVPRPDDPDTFARCKLDFAERESQRELYALHRDLLRLRRDDPVLSRHHRRSTDGAVLGPGAFVLRFFGEEEDRLLLVNLDSDLHCDPAPEPLLAPPIGHTWAVLWSSEDPRYGGLGTPAIYSEDNWHLPGGFAVLLRPEKRKDDPTVAITDRAEGGNV
jgi:maltooligosyltrehalose trehalohydrolase